MGQPETEPPFGATTSSEPRTGQDERFPYTASGSAIYQSAGFSNPSLGEPESGVHMQPEPEPVIGRVICPYRGLAPFREQDARWFFGRERETEELVHRLGRRLQSGGLAAVVGPAGSGKTSLLRAGLLSRLAAGILPGSDSWPRLLISPSPDPVAELVHRLAPVTGLPPDSLANALTQDPRVGAAMLRDALPTTAEGLSTCLVIVLDQLEELFDLVVDEEATRTFLHILSVLAKPGRNGELPVALVVLGLSTARAERWSDFPELAEATCDAPLLGPLSYDALRSVIVEPAALVGLSLEPGLTELLLNDIARVAPAARLSLLQHTLLSLWQRRRAGRLTLAGYHDVGGIEGCVAAFAERAWSRLAPDMRSAAWYVLLQLIRVGEDLQPTRRRIPRRALIRADSPDAAVTEILLQSRVLSQDNDLVEIAHDALLSAWPRLRERINDDRRTHVYRQEIEDAAAVWERHHRAPDVLYRGVRIIEAMAWAAAVPVNELLSPQALEFLEASKQAHRRSTWLRRVIAVVTVALLPIALVLTMGVLPAVRGWWSIGSFFALWALLAAVALLTARRNHTPNESGPPRAAAVGSLSGAFVSGLLDVWLFPNALKGTGPPAPLSRASMAPSRGRALRNVEATLDRVCSRLGRPPTWHAPAPADPSTNVERGER